VTVGLVRIGEIAPNPIDRGEVLIAGMAAMLITIFLGPKFIEFLRVKEFGQQIREEGPQEHHAKAGTPTMGGIILFLAIAVPYLVLSDRDTASLAVFGVALGCALLGFADDFIKISKRRSLGLGARYKILGQIAIALALWWVAYDTLGLDPVLKSRVLDTDIYVGPVLYFFVIFLVVSGASNAVNLTDGLDGLAAGSCGIVLLAYMAITITNGQADLAVLAGCFVGASIGFLWFNAFPASIFMGDTGSLGLGGAIAGFAGMTQTELLLIIIGGIFVLEALSVAVQVISFKLFRRRVLLMAPVHHHFELLAWSETKIILRFWIVAAVCSAIGFTLYQQSVT
jgi:phospho-N-acetylmuramoyl-pentapeptide-transferase